jgi:hypothetical protein
LPPFIGKMRLFAAGFVTGFVLAYVAFAHFPA